ncbi:MAG: XTP/dITP diphosphohydrolase [Hyphomicrobiaceae bacterium]
MTPISRVVLATGNRGKVRDFERLLAGSGIEIVSATEEGIAIDVDETGTTFRENSLLKARAHAVRTKLPVLADDSGIVVDALYGAPGVISARYAGAGHDDKANNVKLLEAMAGVADRRAAFVVALALVLPDGEEIVTEGRCEGTIADSERGTNGFGYDAVFYREDLGRTFGESTPEEKNMRSHRATAVHALLGRLGERGLIANRG